MRNMTKFISILLALIAAITGFIFGHRKDPVDPVPETSTVVYSDETETTTITYSEVQTSATTEVPTSKETEKPVVTSTFSYAEVPAYDNKPYVTVNGNKPYFTGKDYTTEAFETYSKLDTLGRCGVAYANICLDLMPTESRGDISSVKPTGWINKQYDGIDGGYLYNRCHIIGFQLAGENDNKLNLITGTRYMNVSGMLPFENMVADYVKEEENHVLYRVTPIFVGNELVCRGVLMEAYSVEDKGTGVCYCVFCYNVQPGISIDYLTGNSSLGATDAVTVAAKETFVLNTNSKKFHKPTCDSVNKISDSNKSVVVKNRDELIKEGYIPCGACKP